MSGPVRTETLGPLGLIRIDNPPVNALSQGVRGGIGKALDRLAGDPAIAVILLLCEGRTFIAGADIREFGKPRQPPSLAEVCNAIEASPKPIVAVLHGTALGGGFEVALACHYRVADPEAKVGLPEVKLGLIPGAGGTNRLARIVGPERTLRLVTSGDPIGAADAVRLGIFDRLLEGERETAALAFGRELAAMAAAPRLTRDRPLPESDPGFETAAEKLLRRTVGQAAPAECVASLRRAMSMSFDEAIEADREAFASLAAGDQSRALRHAFFAERQSKLSTDARPCPIGQVAVIGAGTMGGGIAMSLAAAGIPVTLIDTSPETVERGITRIRGNYDLSVERGSIDREEADTRLERIRPSTDLSEAAPCDLVIEAIFEDLAAKQSLFDRLEQICRREAILATNTSALDLDGIASALNRRGRFVGLHFFSPAQVMKLLEVVEAKETSATTLATAFALARRIGKVPVLAGNCDGFIGNRMVAKRGAQVDRLLLEGALPEEVDAALKSFGFPMGPLAINDMSGLDIGYSIRKRRGTKFPVADAVAESGRLGQKTGRGYYRYEPGSRTPLPDPEIAGLIADLSAELGIARRHFSREEMIDRMILPLVNEGARILEEGIARRASDIDAVWINGYGFPRWRGGPMFHADEIGLAQVTSRLSALARETGNAEFEPAPLLARLAATGRSFADWDKNGLNPETETQRS